MPIPLLVLVILLTLPMRPVAGAPDEASALLGDWCGWAYLDAGGDFPMRFRFVEAEVESGVAARFDWPSESLMGIPLDDVSLRDGRLRVAGSYQGRFDLTFEGAREAGDVAGRFTLKLGERELGGDFGLHRSPLPLLPLDPGLLADAVGTWRLGPDRLLVLSTRFWGDVFAFDTGTGRRGALFATSPDSAFMGSAAYVPGPVGARIRLERTEGGRLTGLFFQDGDGPEIRAERVEFRETSLEFRSDDALLVGTLVIPERVVSEEGGPRPAVVVLGGSNWTTHEQLMDQLYLFAGAGIAAFAYDKRGFGDSGGEAVVPFETTAADALAAVRTVAAEASVDAGRVGLVGRSRSGWTAPLAATLGDDVGFLVLFVPPAVSPAEQETTRRLNDLRDDGHSEEDVGRAGAYLDALWAEYAGHGDPRLYAELHAEMETRGWLDRIGGPAPDDPEIEWRWGRLNMHHDPVPTLESLRCPVLAVFGERDRNVVPALNEPLMRASLERAGVSHELVIVPGANHGLRLTPADGPALPLHRQVGSAPGVWERCFAFVHAVDRNERSR